MSKKNLATPSGCAINRRKRAQQEAAQKWENVIAGEAKSRSPAVAESAACITGFVMRVDGGMIASI